MNTANTTALGGANPPTAALSSRLSYPQARLILGVLYVGSVVIVAAGLFCWSLREPSWITALQLEVGLWGGVILVMAAAQSLSFPYDLVGGYLLPRHWLRPHPALAVFVRSWTRGALLYSGFWCLCAGILIMSARYGGTTFVCLSAGLLITLLISRQFAVAGIFSSIRRAATPVELGSRRNFALADCDDLAFSGGISGLAENTLLVFPSAWRKRLSRKTFDLLVERRQLALTSGLRTKGLLIASGWSLTGLGMATHLSGFEGETILNLVRLLCLTTLWGFLGLLVFPTLSRAAVTQIDRRMLAQGFTPDELRNLASETAGLQDGESARPDVVENIFHPLPSVASRMENLKTSSTAFAAWNVSRYALFLSWPTLSLLTRAVHSNAGRPSLWVMGPTD